MPGCETYVPAAHVGWALQLEALVTLLKVPFKHAPHVRSRFGVPEEVTNEPGAHADHGVQLVALLSVLNEPSGQIRHSSPLRYVPAVQCSVGLTGAGGVTGAVEVASEVPA